LTDAEIKRATEQEVLSLLRDGPDSVHQERELLKRLIRVATDASGEKKSPCCSKAINVSPTLPPTGRPSARLLPVKNIRPSYGFAPPHRVMIAGQTQYADVPTTRARRM
jgi:hypothetical protein